MEMRLTFFLPFKDCSHYINTFYLLFLFYLSVNYFKLSTFNDYLAIFSSFFIGKFATITTIGHFQS